MWLALVHQEIGVSWLQVVIDGFALALAYLMNGVA